MKKEEKTPEEKTWVNARVAKLVLEEALDTLTNLSKSMDDNYDLGEDETDMLTILQDRLKVGIQALEPQVEPTLPLLISDNMSAISSQLSVLQDTERQLTGAKLRTEIINSLERNLERLLELKATEDRRLKPTGSPSKMPPAPEGIENGHWSEIGSGLEAAVFGLTVHVRLSSNPACWMFMTKESLSAALAMFVREP